MDEKTLNSTPEELDQADKLIKSNAEFILSVAHLSQLPNDNLPEIAFAGRSNVGKSSIINALTAQRGLAKTSNTPGRTQMLNFFKLAQKIYLVMNIVNATFDFSILQSL